MAFFPERLQTTQELITREGTPVAAGTAVNPGNSSFLRVTSGTLLQGIANGINGMELTLINATAATIQIDHNSASAAVGNKIATGTNTNIGWPANSALFLKYTTNLLSGGAWQIVGMTIGTQAAEGAAIAASNNVALGWADFVRITSGTILTGFAGGISGYELKVINTTAATISVEHNSASSTVGNRIASPTGFGFGLPANASMTLKYSANLLSGAGGWQVLDTVLGQQLTEGAAIAAGNNVALAWSDFVRITSGTSLTGLQAVTGTAGSVSGYQLTLINATAGDVTIANNSGSSVAGNKILTGTGGDIALPTGAALYLKYSANLLSGAGAWQVVGGVAGGFKTSLVQNISAAGTPTISTQPFQRIKVQGNGAAVTMASTLAGGTDGMELLFIGNDSTNTVTIAQNDASNGFILNGDVVLSKFSTLLVQYDSATSRWVEVSRNMIASYV